MEIKNSNFVISATNPKQYPTDNLPEIVLIGKSNIGKSSFINCLTNRTKLAKTSSSPGKTRLINYYNIDNLFFFVDLPGYGYSKMSKSQEETVANYINEYLTKSKNISLIIFLVDIRHKPTNLDIVMFNWLIKEKKEFIVLANKADKIAKTKIDEYIKVISDTFRLREYGLEASIPILPFSSVNKLGKEDLLDIIEKSI